MSENKQKQQDMDKAVKLSHAMLTLAQQEKWDEFSELNQQRHVLFESVFTAEIAVSLRASAVQSINTIQAIDARILPLAQTSKTTLQTALSTLQKGKKASALYANE